LFSDELAAYAKPHDKIFKRDCLELDLRIGGRPLTLYVVHFKSMGNAREPGDGRISTMPVRGAEAKAVRRIIEDRFGTGRSARMNFAICGDMNDYKEKVVVGGSRRPGYAVTQEREGQSAPDVVSRGGVAEDPDGTRHGLDR